MAFLGLAGIGHLVTDPPDAIWELGKIIVGVAVASVPPLLAWIGSLIRTSIKKQEKLERLVLGEEGRDGLSQRVTKLEVWQDQATQEMHALGNHVGEIIELQYRDAHTEKPLHAKHRHPHE